jgi:hypothetical protein
MKLKIAAALLSLALLPACSTTQTAEHRTLEERMKDKYAGVEAVGAEPASPAEGPDDIAADAPNDVNRNPKLLPSPLLRQSAASGL